QENRVSHPGRESRFRLQKAAAVYWVALDKPDFPSVVAPRSRNGPASAACLNTSASSLIHPVAYEVAMAKMDHCPICNVAVKPENLIRHLNDNHPRHPDRPGLLEKLQEEPGRIRKRQTCQPFRVRRWQIALVSAIVVGGLSVVYLPAFLSGTPAFSCQRLELWLHHHWHTDA